MPSDKFNIPFFHASKDGGMFYQMSDNPNNDDYIEFTDGISGVGNGQFTMNPSGRSTDWELAKNSGFNNSIGGNDMNFKETAARGYAWKSNDARDVEIKFICKISGLGGDKLSIGGPTGRHTTPEPCCQGFTYMISMETGTNPVEFQFRKEMWHVSYSDSPEDAFKHNSFNFKVDGHGWFGYGYCRYNKKNPGKEDSVVLEVWANPDPVKDIKNWIMVGKIEDSKGNGWGDDGEQCSGDRDQVGTWSNAKYRVKTNASGGSIVFKAVSMREIDPYKEFDEEPATPGGGGSVTRTINFSVIRGQNPQPSNVGITRTFTEELVEHQTDTDPLNTFDDQAWKDYPAGANGEIGDKCDSHTPNYSTYPSGLAVQPYWSNSDNNCVVPGVDEIDKGSSNAVTNPNNNPVFRNPKIYMIYWGSYWKDSSVKYSYESKFGTQGTGNGQFEDPHSVDFDSQGNVFVSDRVRNDIQKFTHAGVYISKFGGPGSGNGQFNVPYSITLDPDDNVYVTDRDNNRVQKFNSAGVYQSKITEANGLKLGGPEDIAFDFTNGDFYVTDTDNNRIVKFDKDHTFIRQWGSKGSGNGQFDHPHGIDVGNGSDRNVYINSGWQPYIQKFTKDGVFIKKWGTEGRGEGQVQLFLEHLDVDINNRVHLINNNSLPIINVWDTEGVWITKYGMTTEGSANGQFKEPEHVTCDAQGKPFVVDSENNRIQVFSVSSDTPKADTLTDLIKNKLLNTNSQYFSKLNQYGGCGVPVWGGALFNTLTPVPSSTDIKRSQTISALKDCFNKGILNIPNEDDEIIYFLIIPSNKRLVNDDGTGGFVGFHRKERWILTDPGGGVVGGNPITPPAISIFTSQLKLQWHINYDDGPGCGPGGLLTTYNNPTPEFDSQLSDSTKWSNQKRVGQKIKDSSSSLRNVPIKQCAIPLKKVLAPGATPVISLKIWTGNTIKYTSGTTINPTILTTSYPTALGSYSTFDMSDNTYVMQVGDIIGIEYTGTSDTNYVVCSYTGETSTGSNTQVEYENGVWLERNTRDMVMVCWK